MYSKPAILHGSHMPLLTGISWGGQATTTSPESHHPNLRLGRNLDTSGQWCRPWQYIGRDTIKHLRCLLPRSVDPFNWEGQGGNFPVYKHMFAIVRRCRSLHLFKSHPLTNSSFQFLVGGLVFKGLIKRARLAWLDRREICFGATLFLFRCVTSCLVLRSMK